MKISGKCRLSIGLNLYVKKGLDFANNYLTVTIFTLYLLKKLNIVQLRQQAIACKPI